jgi:maltose/moltooligosaccharide transporter
MKLDIKKTLLISVAFFTISLAWTIYNNYVPIFLKPLLGNEIILGVIMTFDNLFGVIFQPFFGRKSDRTWNRFGRRMPYLLVGIPLAAVFFAMIPWYNELGAGLPPIELVILMLFVILMNFSMSIYRAPAVALMPDATPPEHRSKANGIINAIGGLGTIIAFVLGGRLYGIREEFPFLLGSGLMVVSLIVLFQLYKEPRVPYSADEEEGKSESDEGLFFSKNGQTSLMRKNPSLIKMLMTVFFWFCGFECINAFFTLYCKEIYALEPGDATPMLAPMAVVFMLCAFPGGLLGAKIGRKRAMFIGNGIIVAAFACLLLIKNPDLIGIFLAIGGVGWAFMNANAYPAIAEMAPAGKTGLYTGYYYAFTFAASIASPIAYGAVSELSGTQAWLFLFGGVMFVIALLLLATVKKTEADIEHAS